MDGLYVPCSRIFHVFGKFKAVSSLWHVHHCHREAGDTVQMSYFLLSHYSIRALAVG